MIGYLEGTVVSHKKDGVVVKCGPVGYRLFTLSDTRLKENGVAVALWTYLAVRENALDLYGFESEEELAMFELLLTVSGIGPKSALASLEAAGVTSIKRAVGSSDAALLTKLSGIGKKTSEKIVLELKGKIGEDIAAYAHESSTSETIDALISLGYSERQAREAFEKIKQKDAPTGELIKEALKHIS